MGRRGPIKFGGITTAPRAEIRLHDAENFNRKFLFAKITALRYSELSNSDTEADDDDGGGAAAGTSGARACAAPAAKRPRVG